MYTTILLLLLLLLVYYTGLTASFPGQSGQAGIPEK